MEDKNYLLKKYTIRLSTKATKDISLIDVSAYLCNENKLEACGSLRCIGIDRPVLPNFYQVIYQYSPNLFYELRKIFFINGTLRRCKWGKISDAQRYAANHGKVIYIDTLTLANHNGVQELGFLLCQHLLIKMKKKFTLVISNPDKCGSFNRRACRAFLARLGFMPLKEGGDYPYDDFWYLLPENVKFRGVLKTSEVFWNIPIKAKECRYSKKLYEKLSALFEDKIALGKELNELSKEIIGNLMIYTTKKGDLKMLEFLIYERHADVNYQDVYGNCGLHYCKANASLHHLYLNAPNIDKYIKNNSGMFPYDIFIDKLDEFRSLFYAKSLKPQEKDLIELYDILHLLIPPNIQGLLVEDVMSPVMLDHFASVTEANVLFELPEIITEEHFKPMERKIIDDVFIQYFPKHIRETPLSKSFLQGFDAIVKTITPYERQDKRVPTMSRILEAIEQKDKVAVDCFFQQGGSMQLVFSYLFKYVRHLSMEVDNQGWEEFEESESYVEDMVKIPYFDDDYDYLRFYVFKILLQN